MVDVDLDTRLAVSQKQVVHTLMYAQIHVLSHILTQGFAKKRIYILSHMQTLLFEYMMELKAKGCMV